MRMWNVDPKIMCRKHLLGEHVEMHMFIGSLKAGRRVQGHIDRGQLEVHNIIKRHDELADEIQRRGYKHKSPLHYDKLWDEGYVDKSDNRKELRKRCVACRKRQDAQ